MLPSTQFEYLDRFTDTPFIDAPTQRGYVCMPKAAPSTSTRDSDVPTRIKVFIFTTTPAALEVPELFDMIMHYLPVKDVIRLRRVSTEWRDKIDGGKLSRKAAFLKPATEEEARSLCKCPMNSFGERRRQGKESSSPERGAFILNSSLFNEGSLRSRANVVGYLKVSPLGGLDPSDLRGQMFLTQPPVRKAKLKIQLHSRKKSRDTRPKVIRVEVEEAKGLRFSDLFEPFQRAQREWSEKWVFNLTWSNVEIPKQGAGSG